MWFVPWVVLTAAWEIQSKGVGLWKGEGGAVRNWAGGWERRAGVGRDEAVGMPPRTKICRGG